MKYLRDYLNRFSYDNSGLRQVGLELEYPVVSQGSFEQFSVIPSLELLSGMRGSVPIYDDYYEDQIVGYEDEFGNTITPEFSTSVLEIAFPPEASLIDFDSRNNVWLRNFREFFASRGGLILGYGGLPITSNATRTKKRRYEVLRDFLGPSVDVIGLTASSQVSIEVSQEEMVIALNVCNAFSGPSIALTANSSVVGGENTGLLGYREAVWDIFSSERCGVPPAKFYDIEEYLEFLFNFPIVIEKGEEDYYIPGITFSERISGDYNPDLFWKLYPLHEGTIWFNARLRAPYGTIEIRPNCTQPHGDYLAVAAFWLGIIEQLSEANELMKLIGWDAWRKFRIECIKHGMDARVDGIDAHNLVRYILGISERGLKNRGLGEEVFLDPLKARLHRRKNPAQDALEVYNKKGIKAMSEFVA